MVYQLRAVVGGQGCWARWRQLLLPISARAGESQPLSQEGKQNKSGSISSLPISGQNSGTYILMAENMWLENLQHGGLDFNLTEITGTCLWTVGRVLIFQYVAAGRPLLRRMQQRAISLTENMQMEAHAYGIHPSTTNIFLPNWLHLFTPSYTFLKEKYEQEDFFPIPCLSLYFWVRGSFLWRRISEPVEKRSEALLGAVPLRGHWLAGRKEGLPKDTLCHGVFFSFLFH